MSSYSEIIKKIQSDWKAPHLMDGALASRGSKIPFSSPLLNYATYGGIPRDKCTEFCGDPGSGKTTTSIDICKNAYEIFKQEWEERLVDLRENGNTKADKMELARLEETGPRKVLYIDLEHAFDVEWSRTLGIDLDEIAIMQPPDIPAEKILEMVKTMIESNEVGLIVLDSIPSLVTQAELEKKFGERTVASLANLMTVFMRKVVSLLTRYNTTLLLINQLRDNQDNPWNPNTPGGRAIKFYSSLRIMFSLGNPIDIMGNELKKSIEECAGYIINCRLMKQKSAPFDRKNASYYLLTNSGINPIIDYAQLAVNKYGIIKAAKPWFTMVDPYTGEIMEDEDGILAKVCGMPKVYDYLETNQDYFNLIKKYIDNDICGNEEEIEEELSDDEADELEDTSEGDMDGTSY